MAWLCIDAGTSLVKAVLLAGDGRELAVARHSVTITRPQPNQAEQDMQAVWEATVCAAREITAQTSAEIEGIVTTAQGDGCWLVDGAHQPIGPAILWNDGRAHQVTEQWRRDGVTDAAFRLSGSIAYPGLANAIWRWLDEHDPDRLQRARWLLSCNGWLFLQLTGEIAADLSDASNPLCDVAERAYSPDLLKLYGVERHAHLLPEISSQQAPVAALRQNVAERLGVPPNIPVVMAPYDIVSTAIGAGCLRAGEGCVILGTTICPEVVTSEPGRERAPAGTTIALQTGFYLRAMPTLAGCEALDWAASLLRIDELDELSRLAAASVPGSRGVACLPYLSPAGERSPFLSPSARASLLGLSSTHTREDVARSVFEGLSFVIRDCLAAASSAPPSNVAVCGGGSRSEFWCQLIANVCNCKVRRLDASEVGARGAFLTALYATGKASSLDSKSASSNDRFFTPEPNPASTYNSLFNKFLKQREAVAVTWDL